GRADALRIGLGNFLAGDGIVTRVERGVGQDAAGAEVVARTRIAAIVAERGRAATATRAAPTTEPPTAAGATAAAGPAAASTAASAASCHLGGIAGHAVHAGHHPAGT